jgi:hypothetical protein
MDLFNKLNMYIDYNNNYSIMKAFSTLEREYNLASKRKDNKYATNVINASRKLHDKLITLEYLQPLLIQKSLALVLYMTKKMKSEFGIKNLKKEITDIIE